MGIEGRDTKQGVEPDSSFTEEVAAMPGGENIKKCFACGTCAAGCPVTAVDPEYNSRKIIREVILGMREKVLASPTLWYCVSCYRCSARCPQQVNFTDIMRALRYLAVKHGYAPVSMYAGVARVEQTSQMLRRDLIAETIGNKNKLLLEINAKVKA